MGWSPPYGSSDVIVGLNIMMETSLSLATIQVTLKRAYIRITISDVAKFQTQLFTVLSIGYKVGRVVTFGKKNCYLFQQV